MSGTHALAWDNGTIVDLGVLPGGTNSYARGVNNSNQIAGWSEIEPGGAYHAVIWQNGEIIDLGTVPGDLYSNATAINESGHVAGRSIGNQGYRGFFWNGSSMTAMPMLAGGSFVEVNGMNDLDQVVGRTDQYGGAYQTAFLWEAGAGELVDLQTRLPSGSGWALHEAWAINNVGQITGYGVKDNCLRAFLMTPAAAPAPDDTEVQSVPEGGGPVSTDDGEPGATTSDPQATTIDAPVEGTVVIREGSGSSGVSDFTLLGQPITIEAPPSEPGNPYRITFTLDASVIPAGENEGTIQIFRDGDIALTCNSSTIADPDPCVVDRTRMVGGDAEGDIQITVLTSHASVWGAYVSDAPEFDFEGFFHPVNNAPTLNVMKAGAGVPIKFSLGGDLGLDVLAAGSPSSRAIDCTTGESTDSVEQTVTAPSSKLTYNATSGTYTYTWKTTKSWSGCREFVLTLSDGTEHTALFQFKR
jgi:probable HAF family extracellular repeat protein